MPPELVLFICVRFILWLFAKDRQWRKGISIALWVPVAWVVILGSRPISTWFGFRLQVESNDFYREGSPFDRSVFLVLIVAGLFILLKRRVNWRNIALKNKALIAYFCYLGLSVLWADSSFVSFKRWIKDVGNIIMVLIILTEADPIEAVKTVFARCSYLLIPLSLVFIKYYPDIGRYYNRWTYEPYLGGVTTNKNLLGMTLFVCGVMLFWAVVELRGWKVQSRNKTEVCCYLSLLLMCGWLLFVARSSTALVCTALGTCIILGMRSPAIRSKVKRLGVYSFVGLLFLLTLHATFDLGGVFVQILGRDATLTGRSDIWKTLLSEKINPLIGVGFLSFWWNDRTDKIFEHYGFHLNEAHNGYLETYLNTGLIGLLLLLVVLASAIQNVRRDVIAGSAYGALRFAFLIATVAYNWTEAAFDRLDLVWFVMLLVIVEYPRARKAEYKRIRSETGYGAGFPEPVSALTGNSAVVVERAVGGLAAEQRQVIQGSLLLSRRGS